MPTTRCIATRLIEACAREAAACFDQDARLKSLYSNGRGAWRIKHRPLLPGEAAQLAEGCHLFIGLTPTDFLTGIGQASTTTYVATFQLVMNLAALEFNDGDISWYDDAMSLRRWLYGGGTRPNKTGSIADPDFTSAPGQHEFLTVALTEFKLADLSSFPNKRFVASFDVTWQTREDSQGNRV